MSIVGIVGAGPSGITAALEAAWAGARVLLFDTNRVVGRKLLVTGNGRCNLTNAAVSADKYACSDLGFLQTALDAFGRDDLLRTLNGIGVPTYATHDGWFYPVSDSAAAVAEALAVALDQAGVEVRLLTKVDDVRPIGRGYAVVVGGGSRVDEVDRVVIAAGGKTYPTLGSKGTMFPVLERLGHTVVPVRPALVPLAADVRALHKLQGVRLDVRLVLAAGGRDLGRTEGNLMFTQSGLSGPAAMDLSHLVSTNAGEAMVARIDLVHRHLPVLRRVIAEHRRERMPLAVALSAVMPPKLPPVLLELAGLAPDARLHDLDEGGIERALDLATALTVSVTGTRGFEAAQASVGGVPVEEVEPLTMQSRVCPGLYIVGETLDVVGPCGGYNLQFAFTSGALAGRAAARI